MCCFGSSTGGGVWSLSGCGCVVWASTCSDLELAFHFCVDHLFYLIRSELSCGRGATLGRRRLLATLSRLAAGLSGLLVFVSEFQVLGQQVVRKP